MLDCVHGFLLPAVLRMHDHLAVSIMMHMLSMAC